jgi:hypothetical protein
MLDEDRKTFRYETFGSEAFWGDALQLHKSHRGREERRTAFANPDGSLESMGIQCALCHSTVDSSFAPGIGKRLDGTLVREATFCSPTRCLGSHQHLNLSSAQKNDLVEYLKGI